MTEKFDPGEYSPLELVAIDLTESCVQILRHHPVLTGFLLNFRGDGRKSMQTIQDITAIVGRKLIQIANDMEIPDED